MDLSELPALFKKISGSQASITSASQFCVEHIKHSKVITKTWDNEYRLANPDRKLNLLYLANDILQNSRKKGKGFVDAFGPILPKAVLHLSRHGTEKIRGSIGRLIKVWEERKVLGSNVIKSMKDGMKNVAKVPAKEASEENAKKRIKLFHPFVSACMEVEEAAQKSQALAEKSCGCVQKSVLESKDPEKMGSAKRVLATYGTALKSEVNLRKKAIDLLKEYLVEQEEGLQKAKSTMRLYMLQDSKLEEALQACKNAGSEPYSPTMATQPESTPPPTNIQTVPPLPLSVQTVVQNAPDTQSIPQLVPLSAQKLEKSAPDVPKAPSVVPEMQNPTQNVEKMVHAGPNVVNFAQSMGGLGGSLQMVGGNAQSLPGVPNVGNLGNLQGIQPNVQNPVGGLQGMGHSPSNLPNFAQNLQNLSANLQMAGGNVGTLPPPPNLANFQPIQQSGPEELKQGVPNLPNFGQNMPNLGANLQMAGVHNIHQTVQNAVGNMQNIGQGVGQNAPDMGSTPPPPPPPPPTSSPIPIQQGVQHATVQWPPPQSSAVMDHTQVYHPPSLVQPPGPGQSQPGLPNWALHPQFPGPIQNNVGGGVGEPPGPPPAMPLPPHLAASGPGSQLNLESNNGMSSPLQQMPLVQPPLNLGNLEGQPAPPNSINHPPGW